MRIDIDETWAVVSDSRQYKLVRRTIVQSGKREGETQETAVGYFQSLEKAFGAAGDAMLKESDAVGVVAVIDAARDIGRKLGRLLDQARMPKRKAA